MNAPVNVKGLVRGRQEITYGNHILTFRRVLGAGCLSPNGLVSTAIEDAEEALSVIVHCEKTIDAKGHDGERDGGP